MILNLTVMGRKSVRRARLPAPPSSHAHKNHPFRDRQTKKSCPKDWDKTCILRYHPSWRFAPARFAYFHTRRTGNGRGPRQRLLTLRRSLCPQQSIRRGELPAAISPSAALLKGFSRLTPLLRRFVCLIVLHYMRPAPVCQEGNSPHRRKRRRAVPAELCSAGTGALRREGPDLSPPAPRRPPRIFAAGRPWSAAFSPRRRCPE